MPKAWTVQPRRLIWDPERPALTEVLALKLTSLLSVSLLAALTSITTSAQTPSRLTFEQRVEAQRAIERVYYSHQKGATAPFEDAVTLDTLERKVRAYLGKSIALERYWHTPITAEMLAVEARRMAANTRMPERLREILAALDDDSELILECLVRPALADRLSRAAFGADSSIHATQRAEAEKIHARLETGTLDPVADEPRRTIVDLVHGDTPAQNPAAVVPGIMSIPLGEEEFRVQRDRAPRAVGAIGPVVDQGDQFTIRIALDEDERHARIATYAVAKRSWDDWWSTVEKNLDGQEPAPLTLPQIDFTELSKTTPETPATCPSDDLWDNQLLGQSALEPRPRLEPTAIWTGTRMIVWGGRGTVGADSLGSMDTGEMYDPATNTWQPMSTVNAPMRRYRHSAIWTGSRMIVFGGQFYASGTSPLPLATGGIYDPGTDTWVSMSPASQARFLHTAVWTGSEMIVWGGGANDTTIDTGERYNLATNSWSPVSQTNAPSKRSMHTAVWTGSEMLVWGGVTSSSTLLNDGGRYSPQTNTWSSMSTTNAPEARSGHMAIWTGSRMVVLGGGKTNGGRYNPGNNQWAVATIGDPRSTTAVWTGSLVLAWGGRDSFGPLRTGYSYNPVNDTVTSISTTGAPAARWGHVAAWTGSEMVISHGYQVGRTYGRYDPLTDTWAAYAPYSSPSARFGHTALWTGSLMVVWGGGETWSLALTGYRYDPAIDAWSFVSTANAPSPRYRHTAVWTGSRMIVWGGFVFPNALSGGGLYDPIADSWATMTNTIPPRLYHTALWTGSRMLIWGGAGTELTPFAYYYVPRNDGASYDPQTDLWEPTPTSNAPAPRYLHTAVWTGSKMLVWGGCSSNQQSGGAGGECAVATFGDGRAFDPGTNLWTVINPTGAPSARRSHTAAWDGNRMLVWGGTVGTAWHTADLADGAAYNPSTDGWTALPAIGAPTARFSHSAIWTGREMLIWGGGEMIPDPSSGKRFVTFNTGARYNPMVDAWTPMSLTNAPLARYEHSAIFADSSMIVWGGDAYYADEQLSDGGRYLVDSSPDADGDGLSICKGDCDDTHATVRPGGPQVCDGLNNNCADPSWPALPANERDDDGDTLSECQADCDDARATVYPGAPQLCDGINDDCSDPAWPALSSPESDQDGDSRYSCQTLSNDCNDANAQVWSAPTEVPALDWVDSQSMSWQAPADPGGSSVSFDTLRAAISSDFTGATTCVESDDAADTHADDPTLPVPGQTFFYLVRAENSCPAGQNMGPLGYRSDGTPIAGRVCP